MFRTNRLAAHTAGSEACVHDAPPPDLVTLVPPKRRRKKPPPEPRAAEEPRCCRTCQETKPIELFKKSGSGRGRMCKACDAKRARERYRADLEGSRARSRAKTRAYARSEHGRAIRRAYQCSERGRQVNRAAVARWQANNPKAVAAHRAFRKALRAGEIEKASVCQVQGCECSDGLQGHHPT